MESQIRRRRERFARKQHLWYIDFQRWRVELASRGKVEEVPVENDDDDEEGGGNENWSVGAKTTTLTAPSVFESSGKDKGDVKLIMYLRSQSAAFM